MKHGKGGRIGGLVSSTWGEEGIASGNCSGGGKGPEYHNEINVILWLY